MARIRTIKPEFFTSEDIVNLSPLARLLYIALWCEADREGRMAWKPKTFKMRYLPVDSCNVDKLCSELLDAGLVVQYGQYAFIPAFHAHQHINPRESASQLPAPDSDASTTRQPRVSDATVTHREEGKGKEGKDIHPPPAGVDADVWRDFLKVRKAKKSPVTEIALRGLQREADKAGWTLQQAIVHCIEKNWSGFNAEWVENKQPAFSGVLPGAI